MNEIDEMIKQDNEKDDTFLKFTHHEVQCRHCNQIQIGFHVNKTCDSGCCGVCNATCCSNCAQFVVNEEIKKKLKHMFHQHGLSDDEIVDVVKLSYQLLVLENESEQSQEHDNLF